jgi:hypothetical protein
MSTADEPSHLAIPSRDADAPRDVGAVNAPKMSESRSPSGTAAKEDGSRIWRHGSRNAHPTDADRPADRSAGRLSSNPITSSGSVLTVESSGSSRPTELIGVTGDQLGLFGSQSIRLGDRRRCQAQRDRVKASETDRALNLVMVLRPPCQGASYALSRSSRPSGDEVRVLWPYVDEPAVGTIEELERGSHEAP